MFSHNGQHYASHLSTHLSEAASDTGHSQDFPMISLLSKPDDTCCTVLKSESLSDLTSYSVYVYVIQLSRVV